MALAGWSKVGLLAFSVLSLGAAVQPRANLNVHHPQEALGSSVPEESRSKLIFDYVIVGSGPGGSVMAHRLTEDPHITVAVIEAGTFTENTVGNLSNIPGYNGRYDLVDPASPTFPDDWGFITTPQQGQNGLQTRYMRGKALGGSTNLNAMAWADNAESSFELWAEQVGDDSWTFQGVTKYFSRAMHFTIPPDTRRANSTPDYNPADASYNGPLSVTYPAYAFSWSTWLAVALEALGMPHTVSHLNGGTPLQGSTWILNTVNHTTGERASADRAYLRPILDRSNLHVFDYTFAERILFTDNATATGIEATQDDGKQKVTFHAKREVIIACGAFQSPQLLQVSGIGPRDALEALDIPVIVDRPGVGQNLQDQHFFGISYPLDLDQVDVQGGSPAAVENSKLFNENATGPLTSPQGEYVGFENIPARLRSGFSQETEAGLAEFPNDWPEAAYLIAQEVIGNSRNNFTVSPTGRFGSIFGVIMAPTSIGNVTINSTSMHDHPLINPNWLGTQSDIELSTAIFKRVREAWATLRNPAYFPAGQTTSILGGPEVFPGDAVVQDDATDEQIADWLRENIVPIYHAAATNKMGKKDDPMAVVDSKGLVYGTKKLRISDISAFPFLTPGYAPQAVTYMLSEKISDDVKAAQHERQGGYDSEAHDVTSGWEAEL